MNYFEKQQEQKQYARVIQQEIEIRYPEFKLLYHGTSLSNAKSIQLGEVNRIPNGVLAEQLCESFNSSLDQVISDPQTGGFFENFVFAGTSGKSRENEIYTATSVNLAGSYASRGPEWRYHLLIYFACKELGIEFNVTNHIDEVEAWISNHAEQPAVVVLDASRFEKFPVEDEVLKRISEGSTCILSYPLPASIRVLEYFGWNFIGSEG